MRRSTTRIENCQLPRCHPRLERESRTQQLKCDSSPVISDGGMTEPRRVSRAIQGFSQLKREGTVAGKSQPRIPLATLGCSKGTPRRQGRDLELSSSHCQCVEEEPLHSLRWLKDMARVSEASLSLKDGPRFLSAKPGSATLGASQCFLMSDSL